MRANMPRLLAHVGLACWLVVCWSTAVGGVADPVFPTVQSDQMKQVEEAGDETKEPSEAGTELAPDEHCSVSLMRDPECSDAVAALMDIKAFAGRQVGGMEGPTMLNSVPANRMAWLIGDGPPGAPTARNGSLLDLGLLFEKKCVTPMGDSVGVNSEYVSVDRATDCLWVNDPRTLTEAARYSLEEIKCADQAGDSDGTPVAAHCKEPAERLKHSKGKNGLGVDRVELLRNTLKLPMAYRWLENVVNTMRGDSVGAVPYAPTCYNKLLLLNPEAWVMMPHTRRQPNGYSRRAPSNLYFRDARQGCRRLVPQGSAKEAYDRVVAMPERHFLEWGEELPDNVAHPGYQAQTPWPNNPTFGPSGAGRPSDAVARAGVNGPIPTGALAKALDGASAVLSAGAGKGGKPSAGVVDAESARANFPGVEKLPLYLPRKRCEICVTVMMRKIAQVPFLCHGLEFYFETCNDVLASILHWYPNVVYWSYTGGCKRQLATGEVFVRPCPPHAMCSWLSSPNYNMPFCPYDNQYMAPGLEDSLVQDSGFDTPSDGLPPQGGAMGSPVVPGFGLIGQQSSALLELGEGAGAGADAGSLPTEEPLAARAREAHAVLSQRLKELDDALGSSAEMT